ncbi:Putative oxidoreductase [Glycine soja]|uniref:Putative oxidoreductase n=1 Tax=Glycine soja TaxID=3848 RepID=A0A0B2QS03_GLYSO|nr:Putative oxidoreductase [Glycine soja]
MAANKKKHVLVEKPVALEVAELDRILEAVESNGVQFMDCSMWLHHPRTAHIQDLLFSVPLSANNSIGPVRFAGIRDCGSKPSTKWLEISGKTQLVVDAVNKSLELGCKSVCL